MVMAFARLFSVLCVLAMNLMIPAIAQPPILYEDCVEQQPNYSSNSAYQRNLNSLLDSIYTNTQVSNGFYNIYYGEDLDKVYGIALCRPDVSPDVCRTCIINVTHYLLTDCLYFKEAIGGQDDCMLRYSHRDILSLKELFPRFWVYNNKMNASDVTAFNKSRSDLLNRLRNEAAVAPSKFAMGKQATTNSRTIYALVQCTPDLTESECIDCLYNASGFIPICCEKPIGGRVILPSCNFRYETDYRFYNSISPPPPPGESNSLRIVIIVVVIIATFAVLAVCTFIFMKARKKGTFEALTEIEDVASLQFDFGTIRTATNDFSEANKLGEGGFGAVYKGRLPDGQDIAVKRLSRKPGGQGDLEFKNEVQLVAKLQHRHLVRLLGFCSVKEERLLIYEFVPNSSLNNFIFDPIKRGDLDWETRYKIIFGTARGLVYLHEDSRLRIIHRDLKPSNILLDEEMNPKISDFGMAKLFAVDQTQDDTSRIVGTFGYMPSEYVYRRHFSVKSDVYSFGVLMLEIVSGHKNSGPGIGEEEEDLLAYVWRNWNEGTSLNVIDPTLTGGSRNEIMRCIHIGLLCVQENEANRPTMGQIITMLSTQSITSPAPLKPAFFQHSELRMGTTLSPLENNNSRLNESNVSANKKLLQSNNEASISELDGR